MKYIDRPLGPMLDPDSTKVLSRRILASLIDLGIVVILGALALKTTALKYPIAERDSEGNWQQTASQFQELQDLSFGRFVRIQEFGDTMYVFGGRNFWLGLLFTLLFALLVFLLLPAALGGSPGKRLIGLKVVDDEGEPASGGQHFMRAVVGLVDFLPIAGILGWFVASRDLHTRRFGDRVAKTNVVDAKKPIRMVDADAWHRQQEALSNPLLVENPADLDSMVALNDRLGIPGEPVADDLSLDPAEVDDLSFEPASVDDIDFTLADAAAPDLNLPDLDMSDLDVADLYVPDVNIPDLDVADLDVPDVNIPDLDVPDLAVMPTAEPLPSRHPAETQWEVPVGTPAPVWAPDDLLPGAESAAAQPSAARPSATQPTDAAQPAQVAADKQAATLTVAGGSATDPIWNAEWNSWLYWDTAGERWLRHDQDRNQWIPIG